MWGSTAGSTGKMGSPAHPGSGEPARVEAPRSAPRPHNAARPICEGMGSQTGAWGSRGQDAPGGGRRRSRTGARRLPVLGAIARAICEPGAAPFGATADSRNAHGGHGPGPGALDRAWTLLPERLGLLVREQGTGRAGHAVSGRTGREGMRRIRAPVSSSVRRRNPMSGVRTSRATKVESVDSPASPLAQAADAMACTISRHTNGDRGLW